MKVLFVYKEGVGLGIGYLSSYIKQHGHKVDLIFEHNTFDNMYINLPFFQKWEKTVDDPMRAIVDKKPDIIAFSVATADYQWALTLAKKIKSKLKIPIIFGQIENCFFNTFPISGKKKLGLYWQAAGAPLGVAIVQMGHITRFTEGEAEYYDYAVLRRCWKNVSI